MKAFGSSTAIVLVVAACSSGANDAASCGKVPACGGNIVGTWKIVGACAVGTSSSMSVPGCAGSTATSGPASVTGGTLTFNADSTFTASITEAAHQTLTIPANCLTSGPVTESCSELQTSFRSTAMGFDAGEQSLSVTCTAASGGCTCSVSADAMTLSQSGTYTVSGNDLTFYTNEVAGSSPVGGAAAVPATGGSYCVQGDTLHLISPTNGGPIGDIVATK
jgi:hypothetical protein